VGAPFFGSGADSFSGGTSVSCIGLGICPPDEDTVTYATRTNDVVADPDGIADDGEAGEADMIGRDVERLVGGSGNDVLVGTTAKGRIQGRKRLFGGLLEGRRGNNVLRGSGAGDTLVGGPGHDVLQGKGGVDLLGRRGGSDRLVGGPGGDALTGGDGNDRLVGSRGRDRLEGGDGRDLLLARDGRADFVNGGGWMDTARIDEGLAASDE
jgi:Ca2+-binding RTX toxin-like protein